MNRLLAVALLLLASPALAQQSPPLELSLEPVEGAGPYIRRLRLRSTRAQQVARDRRLLELRVRPRQGRRRHRCTHPLAPRRVDASRVAAMSAGEAYDEWVDVRMYCTGAALRALEQGAIVEVHYGFRARGRRRWVARQEGERRPPHRVVGPELSWPPNPPQEVEGPVRVRLVPTTSQGPPIFRLRVTGQGRVYLRDDLWSFEVKGPLGSMVCSMRRQPVVPIVDFFVRLGRRPRRATLDAQAYCPRGTFGVQGVYEVTPRLELIYDGEAQGVHAQTGTFEGPPAPVRVLRRGAPYVEHRLEDLRTHQESAHE